ncbi:NAD(P)/FAD-dependent oxidoreductase [Nocardioides sp. GY 10113]|uniref:NAD(P)/FAD-dependent oxidoreductase n=1 Tax=Nocardioides sp. GY 10113 TaxID=2569761 RepID=UPI0010A8BA87|nr:FAD-dependent monooxygenase [Nocardioides sp. GY 10113]TIC87610.1 NAD(P)/FAD-dependent oxidoreductase [Nocardioides sp. GY 10113]
MSKTYPEPGTRHHDVVVVGARCAGAATAMLLARAGYDVALLDRSEPGVDTLSTHALARGGVVQLARWGLLDEVLDTGAPAVRTVRYREYGPDARASAPITIKDRAGVDLMLAPRRHRLDPVLAGAAVRAGAALMTRTTVTDVLREPGGRVRGVVVRRPGGDELPLTARLVVGADGVRSRVAQLVGAATGVAHAPTGAMAYTYVRGEEWDGFEFHLAPQAFAGVFPTHGGEACVWLGQPAVAGRALLAAGADRVTAWREALRAAAPDLADVVGRGEVTAPVRGSIGLPNHLRRAVGPGWALVGDAGYHRDPIIGHGITDAFRDAELLAAAAHRALGAPGSGDPDGCEVDAGLVAYERDRDSRLAETFRLARALGAFPGVRRFADLQVELSRALESEALELAARPQWWRTAAPAA